MRPAKIASITAAMFTLLTSAQGFCISRIGNAHFGDSALGFAAPKPPEFSELYELASSGLRLRSPARFPIGFALPTLQRPSIDVLAFAGEYPDLVATRPEDVLAYFKARGSSWITVDSGTACVVSMVAESKDNVTAVATWGPGRGVVLIGSQPRHVREAIGFILSNLRLDPGACGWK